ncbi:MAG TPA: hypothetical protein EYQ81_01540 [Sneathiellales bacterium]|jgi:hypothetical protein|nr:hypothetical protein [Sneathiellales bacterium]
MLRKLLFHGIPLILPFLMYGLWVYTVRRKKDASGGLWDDTPWTWLVAAGFGLMITSLIAVGLLAGDDPGGTYVPPHVVDGVIVPGQVE